MSDVRVLTIHMNSDAFRHSILRVRDTLRAIFAKALMLYTDFMTGDFNLFANRQFKTDHAAPTVGHHLFDTMCPTAFLAPTLTAKICFICTQPQNAFFLAQLALQGNRANGKKSLPGRVPGPKKGTKMVPKSESFQKEFFLLSGQKKSPKLDRALP